MADTRTEKTLADELREAAHGLRTIAQFAISGPWRWEGKYPQRITNGQALLVAETFTGPEVSPYEAQWITLVSPELAEPLASWLEEVADEAERHEAQGMGNAQDEVIHGPCLAVARVLNGGAS